jgi:small-conductance mechanosensitive channel
LWPLRIFNAPSGGRFNPNNMQKFFDQILWNNTIYTWAIALGTIIVLFIAVRLLKSQVIRLAKKWASRSSTDWDDFAVMLVEKSVVPLLFISAFYFGVKLLTLPQKVDNVIHVAYLVVCTFFILRIVSAAFRKFVYSFIEKQNNYEEKRKQAAGLMVVANVIIWILGIIFLLDNLGYNVTTLIAGLGVGGIAIALAAQTVLGDLFSYFVIFFDRPFEIGDFVVVGNNSGVVEYIGIKTTRIRTLSGEQLVCSNTDLTNSRLQNFKRMERRRIVFTLGVTYQSSHQQLSEIPKLVKNIITSKSKLLFDRGHFSGYGDFSLNFEFVYFVLDADYNVYMDFQQEVYLEIFAAFAEKGIEFAYPTQTLFVEKNAVTADMRMERIGSNSN